MRLRQGCLALVAASSLGACGVPAGDARPEAAVARAAERAAAVSKRTLTVGPRDDERWAPGASLPHQHQHRREDIAALEAYARGCGAAPDLTGGALRKALAWARFRCGDAHLPPRFFGEPPFLHPDGHSFAWHARGCDAPACVAAAAAPELHHALERAELDPARGVALDRPALARLLAGEPYANVGEALLVRRGAGYAAITAADVERADPRFGVGSETACDVRALGRCWTDRDARRSASTSRRLAAAAIALAVAALVAIAAWRVRAGRRLAAERVFVLRWLAHELRTPVTALKLQIERARDGFDELPGSAQDGFLTMARDVARLQRVVEASAVYLRTDSGGGEPPKSVASLRGFVEAVVGEATEADVEIDAPAAAVDLRTGATALALRNLVRNAVEHGKPPVRVEARLEPGHVAFVVADAGDLAPATIAGLGAAFAASGSGLGLGLYLAQHAARSMGGKLAASRAPTRFTLRVPRGAS